MDGVSNDHRATASAIGPLIGLILRQEHPFWLSQYPLDNLREKVEPLGLLAVMAVRGAPSGPGIVGDEACHA